MARALLGTEAELGVDNGTALSFLETLLSAGVMLLVMAVSRWLELDLESDVALATVRTVVQLSVLGSILEPVFQMDSIWPLLAVVTFMLSVVAFEAQAFSPTALCPT